MHYISLLFFSFSLYALECRDSPGAISGIRCTTEGEDKTVHLQIRRMPGAGFNSGITVVDICQFPREELPEEREYLPNYRPKGRPEQCLRRYCTEVGHEFGFFLEGLFIPLPTLSVSLSLGRNRGDFTVECENIDWN